MEAEDASYDVPEPVTGCAILRLLDYSEFISPTLSALITFERRPLGLPTTAYEPET